MSIASAIATKQQQVADSYTAVSNKGGTLPATQNLTNLPTAISSIPSGGSSGYAEFPSYEINDGVAGARSGQIPSDAFSGIVEIDVNGMEYVCYRKTNLAGALIFPDLEEIKQSGLASAFLQCFGLTSVSFPSLEKVGQHGLYSCFSGCTGITSVYFENLTTIWQTGFYQAFQACSNLTSVTFPKLNWLRQSKSFDSCFQNCSLLQSVSFPALNSTSFGSSKDQFYRMLRGVTGATVHFPSNLQSVIGSWSDVNGGFAGTNTTVLFDLAATS